MVRALLLASSMVLFSACASFNNPKAGHAQKEYEVADIGWRATGNWRAKWVESDSVVSKEAPEDPLKKINQKAVENRLSDHETEAPNVNPDF